VLLIDRGRIVLDAEADELRDSALTVSGPAEAVRSFARQHDLLHTESLGGHSRPVVRVDGRTAAAAAGPTTETTNLQQLVVALRLRTASRRGPVAVTDPTHLEEVS
jgi:ABC-2 type transport system ATP-binding protein